ncbi:MAG: class I SAM-dependent methyltransferase [Candidatus Peregrinibacteria bacterium]
MIDLFSTFQSDFERRRAYLEENGIESYRLHVPDDLIPAAIDIYKESAVIHVFDKRFLPLSDRCEEDLKNFLNIQNFFYKNKSKDNLAFPDGPHHETEIQEYGCRFHLNLSGYLDTGLFLDHRETRRWIASQSVGKIVLNTFAYTGSFSVHAAKAGAAKTYSVDLSKTYCEWIKKNLALNDLHPETNWVYKMDTLEFFKYAKKKGLTFDIIIIDPPTFSRNKGESFSVQKDHPALLLAASALLRPRGFILFSTNDQEFRLNRDELRGCKIEERKNMLPPDFEGSIPHKCCIIT